MERKKFLVNVKKTILPSERHGAIVEYVKN